MGRVLRMAVYKEAPSHYMLVRDCHTFISRCGTPHTHTRHASHDCNTIKNPNGDEASRCLFMFLWFVNGVLFQRQEILGHTVCLQVAHCIKSLSRGVCTASAKTYIYILRIVPHVQSTYGLRGHRRGPKDYICFHKERHGIGMWYFTCQSRIYIWSSIL